MIDGISHDDFESWRSHPVTRALLREVEKRKAMRALELRNASVDAGLDRVRRVSGMLEELEWASGLFSTKGVEE